MSRNQPPSEPGPADLAESSQTWNASDYARNGRFVATLGLPVVDLLTPAPGEHILDLGCGDGELTSHLASLGAIVTGLDPSAGMAAATRARGLPVLHLRARDLACSSSFDAVFSNASLHWIVEADQPASLGAVFRSLRPGGRLVAEMGGHGNIAAIRSALRAILAPLGVDAEAAASSFFPTPAQYRDLLEHAGFRVETIALHPRPTPLPHGVNGMAHWLRTFRSGVLSSLSPPAQAEAVHAVCRLLEPILTDEHGHWTANYVRLRFRATREQS